MIGWLSGGRRPAHSRKSKVENCNLAAEMWKVHPQKWSLVGRKLGSRMGRKAQYKTSLAPQHQTKDLSAQINARKKELNVNLTNNHSKPVAQ